MRSRGLSVLEQAVHAMAPACTLSQYMCPIARIGICCYSIGTHWRQTLGLTSSAAEKICSLPLRSSSCSLEKLMS
jgi:hypothetical protein